VPRRAGVGGDGKHRGADVDELVGEQALELVPVEREVGGQPPVEEGVLGADLVGADILRPECRRTCQRVGAAVEAARLEAGGDACVKQVVRREVELGRSPIGNLLEGGAVRERRAW
jgi:hypothetical protein